MAEQMVGDRPLLHRGGDEEELPRRGGFASVFEPPDRRESI